jgi:hypothetical protein
VIVGILKQRRWSAYGGALFILALAGVAAIGLARLGVLGRCGPALPWERVKRVAAVSGDRVQIENKRLIVNETPAVEPYAVTVPHISTRSVTTSLRTRILPCLYRTESRN